MNKLEKKIKAIALAAVMVGWAGPLFSVFTPTTSVPLAVAPVVPVLQANPNSGFQMSFGATAPSTTDQDQDRDQTKPAPSSTASARRSNDPTLPEEN